MDEKLQGDFSGQLLFCFCFSELPRKKKKKERGKRKNLLFNEKKNEIGSGPGRLYRSFFPSDVSDKRENSGPVFWNVSLIPSQEIDPQNPQILPPNLILTTSHPPITRAPFDTCVVWSQLALTYRPSVCPSWLSRCAGALWSSQSFGQ